MVFLLFCRNVVDPWLKGIFIFPIPYEFLLVSVPIKNAHSNLVLGCNWNYCYKMRWSFQSIQCVSRSQHPHRFPATSITQIWINSFTVCNDTGDNNCHSFHSSDSCENYRKQVPPQNKQLSWTLFTGLCKRPVIGVSSFSRNIYFCKNVDWKCGQKHYTGNFWNHLL